MTHSRDTPTAADIQAADSHARLPLDIAWHEQTEYEVEAAYAEGYRRALLDIAVRAIELDDAWLPVARQESERRVATRAHAMEASAATFAGSTWRGQYPGGPVDWETGRLAQAASLRPRIGEAA